MAPKRGKKKEGREGGHSQVILGGEKPSVSFSDGAGERKKSRCADEERKGKRGGDSVLL